MATIVPALKVVWLGDDVTDIVSSVTIDKQVEHPVHYAQVILWMRDGGKIYTDTRYCEITHFN